MYKRGSMAALAVFAGVYVIGSTFLPNAVAEKTEPLAIGEAFPDFRLSDTTGKEHTRAAYEDTIVVFNFCTQECPFSRAADPSIAALATSFSDKGVIFLGVDSNKDLTSPEIQAYIDKVKTPYPVLKDSGNVLADAVGARVTPEIYIMGKDGKLVYHGAPDNRSGPNSTPTEFYLKDALTALTTGQAIEKTTAKAWGCGINRAN